MFLAMQYPTSIPGVTMVNFLRAVLKAVQGTDVPVREFRQRLLDAMALLKMDEAFARRYVNEGFSGGEKKRAEVLQMSLLRARRWPSWTKPTPASTSTPCARCRKASTRCATPEMGILLITHYQRMLNYMQPDHVHVLYKGRIVRSGGRELAAELEAKGYDWITNEIDARPVRTALRLQKGTRRL